MLLDWESLLHPPQTLQKVGTKTAGHLSCSLQNMRPKWNTQWPLFGNIFSLSLAPVSSRRKARPAFCTCHSPQQQQHFATRLLRSSQRWLWLFVYIICSDVYTCEWVRVCNWKEFSGNKESEILKRWCNCVFCVHLSTLAAACLCSLSKMARARLLNSLPFLSPPPPSHRHDRTNEPGGFITRKSKEESTFLHFSCKIPGPKLPFLSLSLCFFAADKVLKIGVSSF